MGVAELEGQRAGRDTREKQGDADPDDDGCGAEHQRLKQNPQRAQQEQDACEDGPSGAGNLQGAHVPAQSDGAESAQHQPEAQEDGQRGGRERDVEDQDDAEDDLDDASGHHPAAAGDEMAVGRREHHFEDARDQHQPAEDERHAQIALGRVDEGQHADCEQRDADDQQQPPVADGLLRVFDQCGEILHGIWICRFPSKLRTKPDGSPRLPPAGPRLKSGG